MLRLSDDLKKQIKDNYIRRLKENKVKSVIKIIIISIPYLLMTIICLVSNLILKLFLTISTIAIDVSCSLKWWIVK